MPFKITPPLYSVWRSMRDRCLNRNFKQWAAYGGRGISICPEWNDYKTFERDMSPRPPGTSIDRIDNDGNYEPSNCKWASKKDQQRNQRRTRYVSVAGKKYKAVELAEISGLKTDTIVERAKSGFTYEQVLAPPHSTISTKWREGIRKAIDARVAKQTSQTHCKRGHAFDAINTARTSIGNRYCKTCERNKPSRNRKSEWKPTA